MPLILFLRRFRVDKMTGYVSIYERYNGDERDDQNRAESRDPLVDGVDGIVIHDHHKHRKSSQCRSNDQRNRSARSGDDDGEDHHGHHKPGYHNSPSPSTKTDDFLRQDRRHSEPRYSKHLSTS